MVTLFTISTLDRYGEIMEKFYNSGPDSQVNKFSLLKGIKSLSKRAYNLFIFCDLCFYRVYVFLKFLCWSYFFKLYKIKTKKFKP